MWSMASTERTSRPAPPPRRRTFPTVGEVYQTRRTSYRHLAVSKSTHTPRDREIQALILNPQLPPHQQPANRFASIHLGTKSRKARGRTEERWRGSRAAMLHIGTRLVPARPSATHPRERKRPLQQAFPPRRR